MNIKYASHGSTIADPEWFALKLSLPVMGDPAHDYRDCVDRQTDRHSISEPTSRSSAVYTLKHVFWWNSSYGTLALRKSPLLMLLLLVTSNVNGYPLAYTGSPPVGRIEEWKAMNWMVWEFIVADLLWSGSFAANQDVTDVLRQIIADLWIDITGWQKNSDTLVDSNNNNNNQIYIAPYGRNFIGTGSRLDQCSMNAWVNKMFSV